MNGSTLLSNITPSFPPMPPYMSTADLYYKVLGIPGLVMYFRDAPILNCIPDLHSVSTLSCGA
jgi:hypothetical protein